MFNTSLFNTRTYNPVEKINLNNGLIIEVNGFNINLNSWSFTLWNVDFNNFSNDYVLNKFWDFWNYTNIENTENEINLSWSIKWLSMKEYWYLKDTLKKNFYWKRWKIYFKLDWINRVLEDVVFTWLSFQDLVSCGNYKITWRTMKTWNLGVESLDFTSLSVNFWNWYKEQYGVYLLEIQENGDLEVDLNWVKLQISWVVSWDLLYINGDKKIVKKNWQEIDFDGVFGLFKQWENTLSTNLNCKKYLLLKKYQ